MNTQRSIRNFAIIAHVDHGKSTLADRMLEITKTVTAEKMEEQFLDQNPISRERGITIKLAPVRMKYKIPSSNNQAPNKSQTSNTNGKNNSEYILNLIDTPGHVDFSYEVSRTLAACEGVVLLVDATQGVQAQTVAHLHAAKKQSLAIVPVINKIDLPNAQTETVAQEIIELIGCTKEEILLVSAKTGQGVDLLLKKIVETMPFPNGSSQKPLRALIFDAIYDEYRGVIAYARIVDGSIRKGDYIELFQSNMTAEVAEVGYFSPYLVSSNGLLTGEIGYVITGIKDIRQCRVGDTIINSKFKIQNSKLATDEKGVMVEALPGYNMPKAMVFFGVFPKNTNDLGHLRDSLGKLVLNDTALTFSEEYSAYLGSGYRVGFLGLLHAEIVKERLLKEFRLDLLFTMPQVLYEKRGEEMYEPYMRLMVYTPVASVGNVMTVCQKHKGHLVDLAYHNAYAVFTYEMPFSMFIRGLSAEVKSVSSGFASIDYELIEYRLAQLVRLEIRINDNPIDVLSEYVYQDEAMYKAREKAHKLKASLPRRQFRQVIQGVADNTIVVREEIPPLRKDVLQKMSGGDRTRKDKLLEKQKKGKSRLLSSAKVELPQEALLSLIKPS